MVIIMIIISNQSPNHGTVILILGIPWSCHRHKFGKESLLVLQNIENLFCEQKPLSCYTGCQHTGPVDFHLSEKEIKTFQVKPRFDTDQIDLSDWWKKKK